jgi:hypothetical protein
MAGFCVKFSYLLAGNEIYLHKIIPRVLAVIFFSVLILNSTDRWACRIYQANAVGGIKIRANSVSSVEEPSFFCDINMAAACTAAVAWKC